MIYETAICGTSCNFLIASWINSELLIVNWGFFFDGLTAIMLFIVCGISAFVHLYSISYMAGDPHQSRFMSYLSLFTGFMLFLVSADNLIVMFFGWEGIGLASFLLISFWHTRIQASKSAIKAMLVNRVGDIGLMLAICAVFLTFKTVDYAVIFAMIPIVLNKTLSFFCFDLSVVSLISFFLFWGVLGKSAQIGLHIWLPDAMEGPTPVSALIHAATLVISGVFLIIRCSIIFENSESVLIIVSIIGALTSFFAASVGLFQNDLKRVIAYSTCSQLGYMVFIAGLSHYSVSLFHVANHAVFKALLFLSAGCIIHGLSDEQDLRKMGGLLAIFPVSYISIFIGSAALIGTPFLTGFYSKDCILEIALAKYNLVGNFCYFLGCSAAFCTAFYSFRLIFLTFVNSTNTYKNYIESAHEADLKMIFPLVSLGLGAIFYGFLSRDLIIGMGSLFFNMTYTNYYNFAIFDSEFLPTIVKNIPLFFTITGALLSLFLIHCFSIDKNYIFEQKISFLFRFIYVFLNKKWHFDQLVNELISVKIINFGYQISFKALDKGLIEQIGPLGSSASIFNISFNITAFQSGFLYHTIFTFVYCFCLYLFIFFLLSLGFLTTIFNTQFFLIIFTFYLLSLFKII
jgi:proton-translocating NADH-quinone oxidoreductase chain L